jgi:hypothetical protein
MLGEIKLLLSCNDDIDEIKNLLGSCADQIEFLSDVLPGLLQSVSILRNDHAHIRAMSLSKFEELYSLLFDKKTGGRSNIEELIIFKAEMLKHIK